MAREFSPSDCDLSEAESVLIVKPSSLGDIVHTLPAVHAIRRAYPDLRIRWVANTEWTPILERHPDVDEVIAFPRRELKGLMALPRFLRWTRNLREPSPPDVALDFQGLFRSALIARRSGAPMVIGLSDAREGAGRLHHRTVATGDAVHAVDRYLALPAALGVNVPDSPEFVLPPGEPVDLDVPEAYVLLHPFSRGTGKSLSPEQVRQFCAALAPMPVIIVGRCDAELIEELDPPAISLLNQTSLTQLIGLMRGAAFVVSVDSGPMHMAAALTPRLLSIHTWSDPRKVGPYRGEAWVWKQASITRVDELREASENANEDASLDERAVTMIGEWVKSQL